MRKEELLSFLEIMIAETDEQRPAIESDLGPTFASFESGFRYGRYRASRDLLLKLKRHIQDHTPREDPDDFDEREGAFRMPAA